MRHSLRRAVLVALACASLPVAAADPASAPAKAATTPPVAPLLAPPASGPLVPLAAIGVSLLILAGATREQLFGGLAGLAVGGLLFLANDRSR